MSNESTCRFCGKNAPLVKSHIIPDFLFKELKDNDGTIQRINLDDNPSRKVRKRDFIDEDMLCKECDTNAIGKWDTKASLFLNKTVYPALKEIEQQFGVADEKRDLLMGLDYKQLKLFILSVLWRAHHSKQNLFKKINLGKQESIIKEMLIMNDPGDENIYEVAMISFIDVTGEPLPLILEPDIVKNDKVHISRFIMGGIAYLINMSKGGFEDFSTFSIKTNGELSLTTLSGLKANKMLKALGVPQDMADYYSFRIFSSKGDIVSMAKNGFFDILLNFRACNGSLNNLNKEVLNAFGDIELDPKITGSNKLTKVATRKFPIGMKYRNDLIVIDMYIKLDYRNSRPFDVKALIACFRLINSNFAGMNIGMPNTWKGYVGWDFDHDKALQIIDKELNRCRVHIVSS